LTVHTTSLLAMHPLVLSVLVDRVRAAEAQQPSLVA